MKHIPDNQYKVGDVVIRMTDGVWKIGTKATVISTPTEEYPDDYEVRIVEGERTYPWNCNKFMLAAIYESPLYKALL